jgi:hypothetical protein
MNVTGVDTRGLEWTGVDIFSAKNFLTQSGWKDEGWKNHKDAEGFIRNAGREERGGLGK